MLSKLKSLVHTNAALTKIKSCGDVHAARPLKKIPEQLSNLYIYLVKLVDFVSVRHIFK